MTSQIYSYLTSGYLSKGNEVGLPKRYCKLKLTAVVFTIVKIQNQLSCPLISGKNVIYIMMKCYSVLKKTDILSFAAKCLELEGVMLSEISQTQKDKHCVFSLILIN